MTCNQLGTQVKIEDSYFAYYFPLPLDMVTKLMNNLHFDFQNNMQFL